MGHPLSSQKPVAGLAMAHRSVSLLYFGQLMYVNRVTAGYLTLIQLDFEQFTDSFDSILFYIKIQSMV